MIIIIDLAYINAKETDILIPLFDSNLMRKTTHTSTLI
jgi:hypothetical protein